MNKPCEFCKRVQLENRVFYEDNRWFAFLAAPYHTKGHTILASKKLDSNCPRGLELKILKGFDVALASVAAALKEHYKSEVKDVLFASARGKIPHTHCHMIPLWKEEEKEWRRQQLYESGHLLEFLGFLEKTGDSRALIERIEKGWLVKGQRDHISEDLILDVNGLRSITGYSAV